MGRKAKAVVDYFPHDVNHGKTLFTLENRYGNDGYSFWFKLLEILGSSEQHFYDCNKVENWEFLLSKTRVKEEVAKEILDLLSRLDSIDSELWKNKIIRSNNFIENLKTVYERRKVDIFRNEEVLDFCRHKSDKCLNKSHSIVVSDNKSTQSKVKESEVNIYALKEDGSHISNNKDNKPARDGAKINNLSKGIFKKRIYEVYDNLLGNIPMKEIVVECVERICKDLEIKRSKELGNVQLPRILISTKVIEELSKNQSLLRLKDKDAIRVNFVESVIEKSIFFIEKFLSEKGEMEVV